MITNSYYEKLSSQRFDFPKQDFINHAKVKAFSESYIVHCVAKALVPSIALSYLGFSFTTIFPTCLAVIAAVSLVTFAVSNVKAIIHWFVDKSMYYLTRIAQTITAIVKKIWEFISYYSLATIHLIKEPSFLIKTNKKLHNNAVISDVKPFKEETSTPFFIPQPIAQFATVLEKSTDLHTCIIEDAPQMKEDSPIINRTNKEQLPLTEKLTQRPINLYPGIVRLSQRAVNSERPCVLDLEASIKEAQQWSTLYLKGMTTLPSKTLNFQQYRHFSGVAIQPAVKVENQRFIPPTKSPTITNSQIKLATNVLRFARFVAK
ncbi:MAG: hypothetical protein ACRCU0_04585 [Candidatus Rhabdochlamydia sp.]